MHTQGLKLHLHTEQGICQGSEGKKTIGSMYWGSVSLQEQTQDPPAPLLSPKAPDTLGLSVRRAVWKNTSPEWVSGQSRRQESR